MGRVDRDAGSELPLQLTQSRPYEGMIGPPLRILPKM
jgi:hypothetical protein